MVVFLRESAGIAFEEDFAFREEEDAVADFCDFDHVVGGPEDADAVALSELADGGANFAGDGGIEGGGGLVEEKQARLVEHGLGEGNAGLLAGGEDAAFGVAKLEEVEVVEDGFDAVAEM